MTPFNNSVIDPYFSNFPGWGTPAPRPNKYLDAEGYYAQQPQSYPRIPTVSPSYYSNDFNSGNYINPRDLSTSGLNRLFMNQRIRMPGGMSGLYNSVNSLDYSGLGGLFNSPQIRNRMLSPGIQRQPRAGMNFGMSPQPAGIGGQLKKPWEGFQGMNIGDGSLKPGYIRPNVQPYGGIPYNALSSLYNQ